MLKYCRPLVEDGRVFKANPPLFGAKIGGKQIYFGDKKDYTKYIQQEFSKANIITDMNGNKISDLELRKIFMINEDFVFELEHLATTFALDPELLELLLLNRSLDFKSIKSSITNNFRFMKDIKQIQGTIYANGLINGKINTAFLNDKMLRNASTILDIIERNSQFYFKCNDKPITLYQLMKAFESIKPSNLERYKGLGEMSTKELRASTLDPEGSRLIIRYTAKDIEEELQQIRYFNSNMDLIGKDYRVTRLDLID